MELGVAESGGGAGGKPLEQLAIPLVETPSPVSLLETWMAPTVTPPATIAVAMTVVANISPESTRGS